MRLVSCSLLLLLAPSVGLGAPAVTARSSAAVTIDPGRVVRPLDEKLFGTNITTGDKTRMADPEFISRVKTLGIKSCRFPNGCQADRYNWKSPGENQATVDEFLDFCDKIGAEAYYTINMQGGTEGLKPPVPDGASLDERIKYQHLAPNPCGDTKYHFGTLAETLELVQKHTIDRAIAGRRPILTYEMGNENWGQATTDWPPDVYARTMGVYAEAMRALLEKAKSEHPELKKYDLYIIAVGFPVMGNNMKLTDTPGRKINVSWTAALNKLHEQKAIDAVQEHFYPYGNANGGTLAWAVHNLHNIILARKGKPNSRLAGYRDLEIAYNMPMEHTEWNVKCWGSRFRDDVAFANGGFEEGTAGWVFDGPQPEVSQEAARRGGKGLLIHLGDGEVLTMSQLLQMPAEAKICGARMWVRSDRSDAVSMRLEQVNSGDHAGCKIGEYVCRNTGRWALESMGGKTFEDTDVLGFYVRIAGPANVRLDEAKLYYTTEERGQVSLSATTFEQQLFCVDAFREMASGGCPRAHLHHLVGDYACGSMSAKGEVKDLGKVFQFFAGACGDRIVHSECECADMAYYSSANSIATDFNSMAPDRPDIPELGCMATRKGDTLHILLVNRTSDRLIDVKIDLGVDPSDPTAAVRTLSGEDIDLAGAVLSESETQVSRNFAQAMAPYSARIITVKL